MALLNDVVIKTSTSKWTTTMMLVRRSRLIEIDTKMYLYGAWNGALRKAAMYLSVQVCIYPHINTRTYIGTRRDEFGNGSTIKVLALTGSTL